MNASEEKNGKRVLFVARHGETDWNRDGRWQGQTDIPLNETGREQARALAQRLRELPIARVYASDLSRARETGMIAAAELGAAFVGADRGLRERNFGVLEGITREEMAERFPELWLDYQAGLRIAPPGAEPHAEIFARMSAAIETIAADIPDPAEAALVISHGGAIRLWISNATGRPVPPLENGAVFRVEMDARRMIEASFVEGTAHPFPK